MQKVLDSTESIESSFATPFLGKLLGIMQVYPNKYTMNF